jgi:hypothetical protein
MKIESTAKNQSIERTIRHVPYSKKQKDFERVTLQYRETSEYYRIKTQLKSDVYCRRNSSEFCFHLYKTVLA